MFPDSATIRPVSFDESGHECYDETGAADYTTDCRAWDQRVNPFTESAAQNIRFTKVIRIPNVRADGTPVVDPNGVPPKNGDLVTSVMKNGVEWLHGDPGVTPEPAERLGCLIVRWIENHRLARELWCEERR